MRTSERPRLHAACNGKHCQTAVPTAVSPLSGSAALLKRWLLGREDREPKAPLGPFHAAAVALAAPVAAGPLNSGWWER